MTPNDVAVLTAIAGIVKQIGTWPLISTALFVIIGPWIAIWWLTHINGKRHAGVVSMYKDNVRLVESHEHLAQESARRETALADMVRLNTQAQVALTTWLKERTRCSELKGGSKHEHC